MPQLPKLVNATPSALFVVCKDSCYKCHYKHRLVQEEMSNDMHGTYKSTCLVSIVRSGRSRHEFDRLGRLPPYVPFCNGLDLL